jgi:hypothetical protein
MRACGKAWYVDIDEADHDDEITYLRRSIYLRDVNLFEQTLTAFDRLGSNMIHLIWAKWKL